MQLDARPYLGALRVGQDCQDSMRRLHMRAVPPGGAAVSARMMFTRVRMLLLIGAALHAAAVLAADSRGPHPVGLSSVEYVDSARQNWDETGPRPLATAVWYPAPDGTRESDCTVEIFNAGRNAMGAPMQAL